MESSPTKLSPDWQYANSELFLLPHFFNKSIDNDTSSDPSFAFTQLLESDSVLEFLMDDWKEKSVEDTYDKRK